MKFFATLISRTGRDISVNPATELHGTKCDMEVIKPLEERVFYLPPNTYSQVKMWDYGEKLGQSILVSPQQDGPDDEK